MSRRNPFADRIATVKATGKRYLVNSIDFRAERVHCFGEVVRIRGTKTSHTEEKSFALADVEVSDVRKTRELLNELFNQAIDAAEAKEIPYLTPVEARAVAKRQRARARRVRSIMRQARVSGDIKPVVDLIDECLRNPFANEDLCGGCGKVAIDEVEGMLVCGDCKVEVMA